MRVTCKPARRCFFAGRCAALPAIATDFDTTDAERRNWFNKTYTKKPYKQNLYKPTGAGLQAMCVPPAAADAAGRKKPAPPPPRVRPDAQKKPPSAAGRGTGRRRRRVRGRSGAAGKRWRWALWCGYGSGPVRGDGKPARIQCSVDGSVAAGPDRATRVFGGSTATAGAGGVCGWTCCVVETSGAPISPR